MLMYLRKLLVALIVVATACFVVGTTIERNSADTHKEAPVSAESTGEAAGHTEAGGSEKNAEARILGIDIEAVPFVILAALGSLALAAAIWLRPNLVPLLLVAAAAMLAFAVLDIREVAHQAEEDRAGLAAFAGVIALLHLAAAGVSGAMGRRALHPAA
jgi:hypothetical protein